MNEMSRTELYEAHQERINNLRNKAIDTKTLSRAYADLAEAISQMPTRGSMWDIAQKDLARKAEDRSLRCNDIASAQILEAEFLEQQGI